MGGNRRGFQVSPPNFPSNLRERGLNPRHPWACPKDPRPGQGGSVAAVDRRGKPEDDVGEGRSLVSKVRAESPPFLPFYAPQWVVRFGA